MSGPPPVVARARTAVRAALAARLADLADATDPASLAPRVLVGVSGGADSLALLATTAWVGSRMGLAVEAAIIDHGLQEGSDRVAERAAVACERLGAAAVHVRRVRVDVGAPGGLENAARDARRAALDDLREDRSALAVLLGHTLDDQAEQVLMALARGSGPRALGGIAPAAGPVLRPFLGTGRDETTALRRADTEEICRLLDVEWWEDPMNADRSLLRARVRHDVLPLLRDALGEHIDEALARSADLVRPDADALDAQAAELLEAVRRSPDETAGDLLVLDAHALAAQPAALRTRVLRDAAREAERAGGHPSDKSLLRRQVLACDALVVSWHGQGPIPLPGRIDLARSEGLLVWRLAPEDGRRRG
ncbi:tRNA lysidine(34) synthetase TilS [Brachybacterium huguangmaarense]